MATRIVSALKHSSGGAFRTFWRLSRQLFHEVIGSFFAVFAAYGAYAAWRQWRREPVWWIMAFAIFYFVAMSAFAVASFLRARRIR